MELDESSPELGNKLKAIRESENKTQVEMAAIIKKSQAIYSKYEQNKLMIPLSVIRILHRELNISYQWFFEENCPMKDEPNAAGKKGFAVGEIKDLRSEIDILFKENKKLKMRMGGYEKEINEHEEFINTKIGNLISIISEISTDHQIGEKLKEIQFSITNKAG